MKNNNNNLQFIKETYVEDLNIEKLMTIYLAYLYILCYVNNNDDIYNT